MDQLQGLQKEDVVGTTVAKHPSWGFKGTKIAMARKENKNLSKNYRKQLTTGFRDARLGLEREECNKTQLASYGIN